MLQNRSLIEYLNMKLHLKYITAFLSLAFLAHFLQAQSPEGFTWQEVQSVDFGGGANHFIMQAASAGMGGEVELRLDTTGGPVIGRTFFHHTGDSAYFLDYECDLVQTIAGTHDVYMNFQDYADPDSGSVLKIGNFRFTLEEEPPIVGGDSLHIYPPVPGLDPSPYYDIYIQKVSKLNASSLGEVTNWETPFAWFTQCPDNAADGDNKGYYSSYIGGWSNTYTNFELDPNTPIVVKIVRKEDTGDDAPAGPINAAVVRPSNKVDSWELIDGDVYITMSQPALVAVDIDGQMETRVSPRAIPTGWNATSFPYRSRKEGAHTVTIFANPFIEDKPKPGDPGVLLVKAGEKIPTTQELLNQDWEILYFEPGVHRASVDMDSGGNLIERKWLADDPITLQDNKSYYIPGDAIVYGNFTDINRSNNQSVNIRVYGHGTISGSKINHNKVEGEVYSNDGWWTRALYVRNAQDCHYEGITAVDPAFHTLCIVASVKDTYDPNTIKWTKVLAWRTNSDGTAVSGNTQMEDCFIRCQDDGHYIGGTTRMRRVVFWHDVNGQTFRGDFTNRRYSEDNAPNIPDRIIYEDIDVIYARGVFSTSNTSGFSIFGVGGGSENEMLEGGVENTGQMVLWRNINISDPLPCRKLISFDVEEKAGDYAGIRFENIQYQGQQVFGWKNWLVGSEKSAIRNFVFDNVSIHGQPVDQEYVNNPAQFGTDSVFDITYRRHDTISSTGSVLTSTATNGWITIAPGGIAGEVTVTASPMAGYRFTGWKGDLNSKVSTENITLDRDKAITANFELITYTISTSAVNGSIILEPQLDAYLPGTQVTVTAVGDLGYGLESWGGDLTGSENPYTLIVNSDQSIEANFKEIETYELTIDAAYGSVLLDPTGGVYNPGTEVSLLPEPDPGYTFEQWFGDITGLDNPGTITMDTTKAVNARFVYEGYGTVSHAINFGGPDYIATDGTLFTADTSGAKYITSAEITGTEDDFLYQSERWGNFSVDIPVDNGNYEVMLLFAEIYHNAAGSRKFNVYIEGEKVISELDIYAKVGKNAAYNESHQVIITDGEINILFETLINNAKISAIKIFSDVFDGTSYTLTTGTPANGAIEVDPAQSDFPGGSNVQLNAIPDPGYAFTGWSGDIAGLENPVTLYMDSDKNISAIFTETNYYSLEINAENGNVSVDPGEGMYGYVEGTIVSLIASPDNGYRFTGWNGDLSGTENPVTLTMDSDKTITANFELEIFYDLATEALNGSVSIDPPGGSYRQGTTVKLTAVPDPDFVFLEWMGDLSGSGNPVSILMDSDKSVTAVFRNPNALSLVINAVNGTVQLMPEKETYFPGSSVILTAIPDEGYEFSGWEGDLTGTDNPAGLIMDEDKNITALFSELTGVMDAAALEGVNMQIYPNPFSSETTIQYELHTASHVRLSIYNLLGQKAAILVNEFQDAGSHSLKWQPKNSKGHQFAGGIYICLLETDNGSVQMEKVTVME